jgi:hypothetical protein
LNVFSFLYPKHARYRYEVAVSTNITMSLVERIDMKEYVNLACKTTLLRPRKAPMLSVSWLPSMLCAL